MNNISIRCSSFAFPYIPDEFYYSEELKKAVQTGKCHNVTEIEETLTLMSVMYWHISFYLTTNWATYKFYRSSTYEIEEDTIGSLS